MSKLTKTEIDSCKQVAEKYIKEVKYGEWYLLNDKPILCAYANRGFHKSLEAKNKIVPLWTISDCLEFLRERGLRLLGLQQTDDDEYSCGFCETDDLGMRLNEATATWRDGETPLDACLKAVLAVREEE